MVTRHGGLRRMTRSASLRLPEFYLTARPTALAASAIGRSRWIPWNAALVARRSHSVHHWEGDLIVGKGNGSAIGTDLAVHGPGHLAAAVAINGRPRSETPVP